MSAPVSDVVTIKVPFTIRKRGGRKLVLAPDGAPMPPAAPHIDSTLVKAIARAFRWQRMLETGRYGTIKEIARAEKINSSYVSRVLRLTLLAPATIEAILDGQASAGPTLAEAMKVFPVEWQNQSRRHSEVTSENDRFREKTPADALRPECRAYGLSKTILETYPLINQTRDEIRVNAGVKMHRGPE